MNRTYHSRGQSVHGYAVREHPFYFVWSNMLSRCTNSNDVGYSNYGGRGITVCRRWYHFENFAIDMWPRTEGPFTIERKNNEKGYEKSNCRWATRTEQCLNRRLFKNNTTGFCGVVQVRDRFNARFDFEHVRYQIGRYADARSAAIAQKEFVDLFFNDRAAAVQMISGETLWCSSTTKLRGITQHSDGNYIARATKNGVRQYLGYFTSIDEANDARLRFLAE